jgi:hypothetical protein
MTEMKAHLVDFLPFEVADYLEGKAFAASSMLVIGPAGSGKSPLDVKRLRRHGRRTAPRWAGMEHHSPPKIASRVDLRHGEPSSVDDRHGRRRVHLTVRRWIRRHAVVETRYQSGGFAAMKWWIRTIPLAARPTST